MITHKEFGVRNLNDCIKRYGWTGTGRDINDCQRGVSYYISKDDYDSAAKCLNAFINKGNDNDN